MYRIQQQSSQGFSLIEVMVSMVVLSIGLLGVAAMFINSIQSANTSYLRSQAVIYGYDLADKIRANPDALSSYGISALSDISTSSTCNSAACTATQMAQDDLSDWKIFSIRVVEV